VITSVKGRPYYQHVEATVEHKGRIMLSVASICCFQLPAFDLLLRQIAGVDGPLHDFSLLNFLPASLFLEARSFNEEVVICNV